MAKIKHSSVGMTSLQEEVVLRKFKICLPLQNTDALSLFTSEYLSLKSGRVFIARELCNYHRPPLKSVFKGVIEAAFLNLKSQSRLYEFLVPIKVINFSFNCLFSR